jgi:hypothetical protein
MNTQNCHCTDRYPGGSAASAGPAHVGQSIVEGRRLVWRSALAGLVSPIVRLHHMRNVRTQMLRDALCELDHCRTAGIGGKDA